MQRVKEDKVMCNDTSSYSVRMFGNERETYKKLYSECCSLWIRNVDHRKSEERVVNALETWRWRGMPK